MVIFEKFESPEKYIFANELLIVDINEKKSDATLDTSDILLFEICGDCNKMAALPQGAFAAFKLRGGDNKNLKIARRSINDEKQPRFMNKIQELGPVKYNEKLMNSIWGLYNRNSPHNFKKNNGEFNKGLVQQQYAVEVPHLYEANSRIFDNFFNVIHPNTPNWDQMWKLGKQQ